MVKKCVAVGDIFITSEMMKAGLERGYEDLMLDVQYFYFGSFDRHEMRNVVKTIETGGFETLPLPEGLEKAIEEAFGVKVVKVNTANTKAKDKRVGRYTGKTKTYKKAFITLADGETIEL